MNADGMADRGALVASRYVSGQDRVEATPDELVELLGDVFAHAAKRGLDVEALARKALTRAFSARYVR